MSDELNNTDVPNPMPDPKEATGFPGGAAAADDSANDPNQKRVNSLSQKAYQALKKDDLSRADRIFNEILKIDPNNSYALVGLGDCERKRQNYKKAMDYYKTCLSKQPGNNYALFGLADCYKFLGQYNQSIKIWEQYLEHDDRNITVLTRVGDAYRKTKNFAKSKELYLRALAMEEDNPYVLIGLGHLYYDFKEYKDALYYWTKMAELHPGNSDIRIYTAIGNCYRKLKEYEDGLKYFQKALEQENDNFYALYGIADCYRGLNQQYRSIDYWNKILEADPDNKVILARAGDAYRNTGNYDKAKEYYERAMSIGFDPYAALGLALILKGEGKYGEAAESFSRLIKREPKNFRFYIDLADCYLKEGDKAKALEVLNSTEKRGIINKAVRDFIKQITSD